MSAGHSHQSPAVGPSELNRIMSDPRLVARLAQKPIINRSYDLPYLCGYSRDGASVYVDRHLPASRLIIGGKPTNVLPFLTTHEFVEKSILDIFGFKYQPAHHIATEVEHAQVRSAGVPVDKYEAALKPYIKADSIEKIKKPPPDLDLTPYIDSKDMPVLMRLRAVMNAQAWRRATNGKGLNA